MRCKFCKKVERKSWILNGWDSKRKVDIYICSGNPAHRMEVKLTKQELKLVV